jgi:hypothetical protein
VPILWRGLSGDGAEFSREHRPLLVVAEVPRKCLNMLLLHFEHGRGLTVSKMNLLMVSKINFDNFLNCNACLAVDFLRFGENLH